MVVVMVAAAVYAVVQVAVVGWVARSVRLRTVLVAVAAGVVAAVPVAVGLEWAWTRVWVQVMGARLWQVVPVAGYTVDPVIEELVKVGVVAVVWWVVPRVRRQWGLTDVVVVCAGVGAGFGLGENLLRFARPARAVFGDVWAGWWWPGGIGEVLRVPGPGRLVGQWLPAGVQSQSFFAPATAGVLNLHVVLSAVAGLGLGLILAPPRRRPGARAAGLPGRARPLWWVRVVGLGLVGFAVADHAAVNAGLDNATGLARALTGPWQWARPAMWVYPLAALAVAAALDRLTLARGRAVDLAPTGGPGGRPTDAKTLTRLAVSRLPGSLVTACHYVRARRAWWTTLARTPPPAAPPPPPVVPAGYPPPPQQAPPASSSLYGPVDPQAGPPADTHVDPLGGIVHAIPPAVHAAAGGPAARTRLAALAARLAGRPDPRRQHSGGAGVLRVLRVAGWLALAAVPVAYLILGSYPPLAHLQDTLTTGPGHTLVVAVTVAVAVLAGWQLVTGARALHRTRRTRPLADVPAALTLATFTRIGSLAFTALIGWRLAHGDTGATRLLVNAHALDAGGRSNLTVNDMINLAVGLTIAGVYTAVTGDDSGNQPASNGQTGGSSATSPDPEGHGGPPTRPSRKPDPGNKPKGQPEKPKGDPEKLRAIARQNETGETMAHKGYDIRYSPGRNSAGKRPDYLMEGHYWDCYAPSRVKTASGVRDYIKKKVMDRQASRHIINLDDSTLTAQEIQDEFTSTPVPGLDEVFLLRAGNLTRLIL